MADRPVGKSVMCPRCSNSVTAIIPKNGEIVDEEEEGDGKVRVTCHDCGDYFVVYYRIDR